MRGRDSGIRNDKTKEPIMYSNDASAVRADSGAKNDSKSDEGIILLRNDISEFTPEEIEELCEKELTDIPSPFDASGSSSSTILRAKKDDSNDCIAKKMKRKEEDVAATDARRKKFTYFSKDSRKSGCCSFRQLLPREELVGGTDAMADAVLNTHQLHAEERALRNTSLVECFLNLTHLYIQQNEITSLDGLTLLAQLTVLVLHHNNVQSLRPLAELTALSFVGARFNEIAALSPVEDLPCESLRYLSLLSNPCCRSESAVVAERDVYRQAIIEACPHLEMLDDTPCQTSSSSDEEEEEEEEEEKREKQKEEISASSGNSGGRSILHSRFSHLKEVSRSPPRSVPPSSSSWRNSSEPEKEVAATPRFCKEFEQHSDTIREMACEHAQKITVPIKSFFVSDNIGSVNDHTGEEEDRERDLFPQTLLQKREAKSRLYADIHFALDMDNAQAQQVMSNVWEDVDKVLRTRQAFVDHRREQMELRRQQPSCAYVESLELLRREQHASDLNKYRR